jgi:hypothetical protein
MGLNLRKIKDAALAQINPFDGGKTANTVWNNTPVGYKDQAQTIRPTGLSSNNGTIYINQQARQVNQSRHQQSFVPGNQKKTGFSGFISALTDEYNNPTTPINNALKTVNGVVGSGLAPVIKTVVAPNIDLTKAAIGQVTGNQQARNNALNATKQDYLGKGSIVETGREWVSRPLGTIGMTTKEAVTGQTQSYDPNSAVDKAIFGDRPIQGIGAGVQDTYRNHPNDPEWKRLAMAGGYGAFQALNAVPVGAGTSKVAIKGAGKVVDKAPSVINTAKDVKAQVTDPAVYALNDHLKNLNIDRARMQTAGLSEGHPSMVNNTKAYQEAVKARDDINKTSQSGSIPNPVQALDKLKVKLNSQALDTNVRPATPENIYGTNPLEKIGKKFNQLLGTDDQGGFAKIPGKDPLDDLKAEARKYKSAEEFIKAHRTKAQEYVGSHQAPTRDGYNAPGHEVSGGAGIYPEDIYTDPMSWNYYGHGGTPAQIAMDKKSIDLIRSMKGNPDREVTIYRAVPINSKATDINPGDWVTHNKDYALSHGQTQFGKSAKIIEKKVKADEIFTDGNSPHEFGYDPRPQQSDQQLTDIYNQSQKKGLFKMNQGGYIKNPLGKDPQVGKTPEMVRMNGGLEIPKTLDNAYKAVDDIQTKQLDIAQRAVDIEAKNKRNLTKSEIAGFQKEYTVLDKQMKAARALKDKEYSSYSAILAEKEASPPAQVGKTVDAPKPVVKIAPPTKHNVVKSVKPEKPVVSKNKGLNDYIDEIAQSQGINTNYKAPKMFAFNRALNKVSGGKIQNTMQINPIRQGAQKLEDKVSSVAQKANAGKGSKTLNTTRTVFAQTGISDADRQANRVFRDSQTLAGDLTKGEMRKGDELASKLKNPPDDIDGVYRVVADDAILERTHGANARAKLDDLSPEARAYADQVIAAQKRTNEINYKIGKIDEASFKANQKTGHYARIFDIESKKGKSIGKKPIDTKPFEKRKDPAEFSDSLMEKFVKDPLRGALARQEIALRSLASHEFMGKLASQGRLVERKPNKGFQQLTGKKYGKFDGMWADNTTRAQIKQNMEFESEWAKRYVGQMLDDFKASPLGKTQRVLKATKTVLNPGTNVQNIMSNILFFNRGSGMGVFRNATGMARAAKDLSKARGGNLNAELIQAKKLGVFGNDSGKAMVGDIGAPDLVSIPGKQNVIMKGLGFAEDAYGGADNAAKLALWRNLQKKGMTPESAAQQVQKFTQDYHNVGRIVGAMADAPVLGKPFARFIPELVRLTKNNIMYNPAGTIAGLAAVAYAGNALSEKAGETDEERKLREEMIGNTSLPGTAFVNKALGGPDRDISLNFAVGDSAVNIARAVGLNFPSEPGVSPNRALLEQLLPFEIPTRKDAQGNEVFDGTKIVTNLGLRPIIEVAADRNFMGGSIQDPENKVRVEGSELGKTFDGDISRGEQLKNKAGHLARAYLPMGNEIDSLVSAFKGEPNAMGKERTPMQAALRTVGVKVEKNDQETRDKRASTKEFFDGKLGQVNDFLNKNPDLKEQYLSIKSGTKDRSTGKKVVDLVGPEKWQKITGDKSGRLFDQMKAEDEYQNKQDPTYPIDPIFSNQLSKEQRNQLLEIRSSYSGSNIEQEEILRATKPWYKNFEAAERDANTKKSAYFDKLEKEGKLKNSSQNERVKAYGDLYDKYSPQQTPLMTKYYQLKDSNPDAAKALFSTNPELSDQFDAYKEQKLKYINEKRKIEGVPAIDRNTFMNVTFGYEDDERKVFNELKYGRGYGGYSKGGYSKYGYSRGGGSGGSGDGLASEYDNPYKYAVSIKAKGSSKATVKMGGKVAKRGVTAKATSKPKVTIKKSTA